MRDPQRFRRVGTAIAMIASPIAGFASWLLWPTLTRDAATFVNDTVATGRGSVVAATLLSIASVTLGIVAVMGLVHLLHDRKGMVGQIGGGLSIVGLALVATFGGLMIAMIEVAFGGMLMADKIALYDTFMDSTLVYAPYVGTVMMAAGMALLGGALYAARVVPVLTALCVGAFGIANGLGFALYSFETVLGSFAVLGIGLIPLGIALLTETDAAWEHPAVFEGFRPAHAGT